MRTWTELEQAVDRLERMQGANGVRVQTDYSGITIIGPEKPPFEPELLPEQHDFLALVTASAAANSAPTTQWTYTIQRAYKSAAGYGAAKWTAHGSALTAYNAAENINSTSGRQGNGIDVAHLDIDADLTDDFDFYPIQMGTPVLVRPVPVAGEVEYWIMGAGMPNGVDGECP